MRYQDYKIPYPVPYEDKDLMMKELINGTFVTALTITLLSGQPLSNRYQEFNNNHKFVENVTKRATDIRSYVKTDDGMAYTLDQIKQMVYLPVYQEIAQGGIEYVYYPPLLYKNWNTTGDNGIVIATFPKDVMSYKDISLYYLWGENQGKFFVTTTTEDNKDYITGFHLLTINGKDITLLDGVKYYANIVATLSFKGGALFVLKFGDNDYRFFVFNLDKGTYKIIQFSNSYNLHSMGSWGLWIKDNKIYDADGNEWKVIGADGINNFNTDTDFSDDYGISNTTRFGDGTIIDGVYYLRKNHTQSYKFIRNIKDKTIKVSIINSDIGEMTSRIKFGYYKDYFKVYGEHTKADVYHYVYKKYNDFWITKMPIKYKDFKNTEGEWFCLGEYGDFMYNAKTDKYYWTWDFSNWFELTSQDEIDTLNSILSENTERFWFNRRENGLVGIFGKLNLKYNSDTDQAELRAYGFAFYK